MSPNEEKQWFSQVQASYPSIDSIFHLVNVSVLRSTNASQCQDVVFDCRDWTLKFATKQTCVAKIQSEMDSFALVWDLFKVVGQLWSEMRWCEMPFLVTSHPTHRAGLVPEKGGLVINDKVSCDCSAKTSARMYEDDSGCTKCSWSWAAWMWKGLWQLNMNWHMKESWESKGVPPMSPPLIKGPTRPKGDWWLILP